MSLKEQFEKQKAEVAEQEAQEEALEFERGEEDRVFWQEKEGVLAEALKELDIEQYLTELRDEIWQLGEITVSPLKKKEGLTPNLVAEFRLGAEWPIFVPAGGDYGTGDCRDYWPDHVSRKYEGLTIKVSAGRESMTVFLSSTASGPVKSFSFREPEDAQKLEEMLVGDCMNRAKNFPYDERKQEAKEEILAKGFEPVLP